MIQDLAEQDGSDVMDPVLELPVRRRRVIQTIHGVLSLSREKLYLIEAKDEGDWEGEFEDNEESDSYLLECNWGVEYL